MDVPTCYRSTERDDALFQPLSFFFIPEFEERGSLALWKANTCLVEKEQYIDLVFAHFTFCLHYYRVISFYGGDINPPVSQCLISDT